MMIIKKFLNDDTKILKRFFNNGTRKVPQWWYLKDSTMMVLKRFDNDGIKNSLKAFTYFQIFFRLAK